MYNYFQIKSLALSGTNRGGFTAGLFFMACTLFVLLYPFIIGQMEQKGQSHERVTFHDCRMHDGIDCILTQYFPIEGDY